MSGVPDHDRVAAKPFLITRQSDGSYRLAVRETRYNSQNYPIVTARPVGESFRTTNEARAYAREHFGAVAGEFTLR
jgi:hypothetical protein